MLAAETREPQPGGEAIITRLADVLVIQAIRGWIAADPAAQTGWLGALRDPHLGRALGADPRDPAREWSVAALAAELADVALGVRGALLRARRRAGHAVRDRLAHAAGAQSAA